MNKDVHLLFEAYKARKKVKNESYLAKDYADEMERRGIGQKLGKELTPSNKGIHDLIKQDSREEYKNDENSEGICIEDLAKKHGVSLKEIQHELEMGIKVETEHTEDFDIATKIALDHLNEDPHYYTKLAKMENKPEDEEEGDLMTHMKQKGMIPNDATTDTGNFGHRKEEEEGGVHPSEKKYGDQLNARQKMELSFKDWLNKKRAEGKAKNYPQKAPYEVRQHLRKKEENEERRLDPKCWKGYHKAGTKLKGGKRVNNCVKN